MSELVVMVSKEARLLLQNIFYNRMIQIESKSEERMHFSRQAEINDLKDQVETFVFKTPYSIFEIRVLNDQSESIEDYKFAFILKNFEKRTDRRPSQFVIIIDDKFTTCKFYQLAINNVLLTL